MARSAHPLIDLRLFRSRSFAASSTLLLLSGLALFGSMLLFPLYYQEVRGRSVVTAGLLLAPQGLGSLLARGAGGLVDRIGPRAVILLGITLTVLGTIPFALADQHTNNLVLANSSVTPSGPPCSLSSCNANSPTTAARSGTRPRSATPSSGRGD